MSDFPAAFYAARNTLLSAAQRIELTDNSTDGLLGPGDLLDELENWAGDALAEALACPRDTNLPDTLGSVLVVAAIIRRAISGFNQYDLPATVRALAALREAFAHATPVTHDDRSSVWCHLSLALDERAPSWPHYAEATALLNAADSARALLA